MMASESSNAHNQEELPRNYEQIQKSKAAMQADMLSGNYRTLLSRVAYILNLYPNTRNSDPELQLKYWEKFEDGYNGGDINPEMYPKFERLTSLARARAKIVNQFKLYFPTIEEVARQRKIKESVERQNALIKPPAPSLFIYADESGKMGQEKYAVVGSLWIADMDRNMEIQFHLKQWVEAKKEQGIKVPREFHFTESRKNQVDIYKEFFTEVLTQADVLSFKAVAANKSKLRGRSVDETIFSLYYQVVHLGLEHETSTRRIALPRDVYYYKDSEDGDKLRVRELKQSLVERFKGSFDDQLNLADMNSLPSVSFFLIQVADLITSSIARVLNRDKDASRNHKDEIAEFVLDSLNIDFNEGFSVENLDRNNKVESDQDRATVYIFD
ncbi:DUF3800 domain-containing protein [Priestia aryabhattai]|uniref:DUF3800 domain-containing protein n=1 Tax=Priestia aryabhattai TaxID=412384 RepID=UPI0009BE90C6|nr:DUF3800 domain-containing protein [Priestia aryabhattai]